MFSSRSRGLAGAALTIALAGSVSLVALSGAQAQPAATHTSANQSIPTRWVERNLVATGWMHNRLTDGVLRLADRRAIKNFQSSRCLGVDGIAGPNTWGELQARVRDVQRAVDVTVDGHYGPATRRAVKRYQHKQGLQVDGIAGAQTMAAMSVNRYNRDCP